MPQSCVNSGKFDDDTSVSGSQTVIIQDLDATSGYNGILKLI